MSAPSSHFLSVGKLMELAQTYPAQALPLGMHQSYPVPVLSPRGLLTAFLYCKAMVVGPGEGYQLWPPSYVALLQAETGRFLELRAVTPKDFGQSHPEDKPLGAYLSPGHRLDAAFLTLQVRWCQALDELLPSFARNAVNPSVPAKRAIDEFVALFPLISEKPLVPYYQAVGEGFFEWLKQVKSRPPTPAEEAG